MLTSARKFATFLAVIAFLAPWVALPHHLREIGHHDDCAACVACEHRASHSEDCQHGNGFTNAPPRHNHDFHGILDSCQICSSAFDRVAISSPEISALYLQNAEDFTADCRTIILQVVVSERSARAPPTSLM
jgi:hypothetical protein